MAKPDLTAGMQAKGPYQQVGHDVDTGLPVLKRRDAQPAQQSKPAGEAKPQPKPTDPAKPEAEPEPESKPDVSKLSANPVVESKEANPLQKLQPANGAKPKPTLKPADPGKFSKGTPVQMADGTRGQVAYSDGKVARVKTEDGKNVNAKHHELTPMNEVKVKAHVRMVPAGRSEK
jgi:hypothetical protein